MTPTIASLIPPSAMPLALQASGVSTLAQFVPLILVFVIMYFLVIAPMRKQRQELERTIAALKKGDRVITSGGIYGEVVAVESQTLILKISDGVKVKVGKAAITGLQPS